RAPRGRTCRYRGCRSGGRRLRSRSLPGPLRQPSSRARTLSNTYPARRRSGPRRVLVQVGGEAVQEQGAALLGHVAFLGRVAGLAEHDRRAVVVPRVQFHRHGAGVGAPDRKSTRLNSSHVKISYAVFCLKKKKRSEEEGAE